MIDFYGFIFTLPELIIFSLLFCTFIFQIYYYTRYMNGVIRYRKKIDKNKVDFEHQQQAVSVIICARDEAKNLRQYLPFILEQEYEDFEVIVINDGSTDDTEDLLRQLCEQYSHLKTTFVPVDANNISTKKLGITLGIKAAKNDLLLFTDADCMPEDRYWIARMVRNFTPETSFVLGYGAYLNQNSFLNRLITYDTLFIGLQYMGMALARKPYMGVGRNLAYRKETFLAQKGFASTLRLNAGDDDLMVNKAATPKNTRIEISPDSITWSNPNTTFKGWIYQKERHLSVSGYYKASSKVRLLMEPLSRGLFYTLIIASFILGNLITAAATGVLLLARYITQTIVINRGSKHFGGRSYYLTLPLFDIYLPLLTIYLMTVGRRKKSRRQLW